MRNAIIGIVIGAVIGVVVGATLLAPRLDALAVAEKGEPVERLSPSLPESAPDNGGPKNSLRMASGYGGDLPQIGALAKRIESEVWRISGGEMEIRFHEPGTLVPTGEMFDAVSSGAIDAAFAPPGFWWEKVPALQLFAAVPFGPTASEYLAWIYFGGGQELFQEIYHKNNIHSVFCGMLSPEASGWFREKIVTVEDLRGLKVRFFGLGANVLEKLGAEPRSLTEGEIFPALESGAIDAAEFSMPAIDLQLGLHEMAKHYYFPGWHQPSTLFELMINLERWNGLSPTEKGRIEAVCGDNIRHSLAEGEAAQFKALKTLFSEGVEIHRWPREIVEALEVAWQQVATEQSEADEDFKRVWASLRAFREDYAIWRELGHLTPQ
ncbi:MAG: TRAP transporter substrate-binding protein [Rhodospirillales bacterium]|nr:TRAP transporter substrate-binding protein [Rhodospirillales bacterium]